MAIGQRRHADGTVEIRVRSIYPILLGCPLSAGSRNRPNAPGTRIYSLNAVITCDEEVALRVYCGTHRLDIRRDGLLAIAIENVRSPGARHSADGSGRRAHTTDAKIRRVADKQVTGSIQGNS